MERELAGGVAQPAYRREDLRVGIVHIGVGNFHRAHQAMYLDRLLNQGEAAGWAICGVGLLPGDTRVRDALRGQDLRYTLVERSPDGTATARSIASIVDFLYAPDDPEAVFERLAHPDTRIVSLTITEGGYNLTDGGRFDADDPLVQRDLAAGATPATVFGVVVEGLRRRRDRGIPPFTVMSCDNLPGNGHVARQSFTSYARLADPELGQWVGREVAFPNSMVDRITPVTTDETRRYVAQTYHVSDAWPVICEDFTAWVLEDQFTLGRPPYEDAGVTLVPDVAPYEQMKLRLLNAGHQAIAYFGYLLGYRFAHEAVADPAIAALARDYMHDEAEPTLEPCRASTWATTSAACWRGSPTATCRTPCCGWAPTARTGSRSSCCRSSGTGASAGSGHRCRPPSWLAGPPSPAGWTPTAPRSASSTGSENWSTRRCGGRPATPSAS